jgi:hypothetical protein
MLRSVDRRLRAAQRQLTADENAVRTTQAGNLAAAQKAARKALPGLQLRYAQLEKYLKGQAAYGTQVNNANVGLLAQIRALFAAGNNDWTLGLAHLAVFLLFFMIEILPVTVKILLNFGKMSPYEVVAELGEQDLIDKARTKRVESRRIEEGKSRVRINVEDDMRTREEDLGKRANEHVAEEMTAILDLALQEWSAKVRARLNGAAVGGAGTGGTGGQGSPGQAVGQGQAGGQPANHMTVKKFVKKLFNLPDSENL